MHAESLVSLDHQFQRALIGIGAIVGFDSVLSAIQGRDISAATNVIVARSSGLKASLSWIHVAPSFS